MDDLGARAGFWRRPAPVALAIGATLAGLAGGYLLKSGCLLHPWEDGFQYRRLCYNDIQPLYFARGMSRGLTPYVDVVVEYPPVTGVFMYGASRLLGVPASSEAYFNVSAALLAPFALAVTLLLRRRTSAGRLMIWAAGSPMVLYAFHNWDLIVVAGAVWGLTSLERGRHAEAGGALAAGASAKFFPALLVAPAVAERLSVGDRKGAIRLAGVFVAVFLVLNVPWIVVSGGNPPVLERPGASGLIEGIEDSIRPPGQNGWLRIWTFHLGRYADFGTVWWWARHHGQVLFPSERFWAVPAGGSAPFIDLVGLLSAVLFAGGAGLFLRRGWRRREEPGGYPVASVSLGILCVFLLVSKVHSPQYSLWVAPLLAMLDVPRRFVLFYFGADLAVFVAGFFWFTVMSYPAPPWQGIFELAVLVRAGALLMLAGQALRSRRVIPAIQEATG